MRPVRVAAAYVLLGVLAACAQPGAAGGTDAGAADNPTTSPALEAWRAFPVDQRPRPIVLIHPPPASSGYRTPAASDAVGEGRLVLVAELPPTPATADVDLPDGRYTVALLPAGDAFERLRGAGDPAYVEGDPPPVRVTSVALGTAQFNTDRGQLDLPAWLFEVPDALGPVAWPALDPAVLWAYDRVFGTPWSRAIGIGFGGSLGSDGVTLTLRLPAPGPSCAGNQPLSTYQSWPSPARPWRSICASSWAPPRPAPHRRRALCRPCCS
ncbi:MAG TPA: hypothetical protein VGJ53_16145 [Micromonosporaceae bacterium]|jgi:hypothetical protein